MKLLERKMIWKIAGYLTTKHLVYQYRYFIFFFRLESLCINGCQNVTDEGLETVIKKHGAR
jgi:hypothetical protein